MRCASAFRLVLATVRSRKLIFEKESQDSQVLGSPCNINLQLQISGIHSSDYDPVIVKWRNIPLA